MRRLAWAVALLVLASGCVLTGPERSHERIGDRAASLREEFNAGAGKVRILMLVSPTCGVCLNGATIIQDDVLARESDKRLVAQVVWVPKLAAEEDHVPEATRTIGDARATHYWDEAGFTMRAFRRPLGLNQDAWDVYLLYGPDVRWEGAVPPEPAFWMHQLGGRDNPQPVGPLLDGPAFAAQVAAALDSL